MKKIAAVLAVLNLILFGCLFLSTNKEVHAQSYVADPCAFYGSAPQNVSVSIAAGTATTTQIVALATGKQIWVCEWTLTVASSATTATGVQFVYGTGANCVTGTTALTGAMGTLTATAGPAIVLINGPYSGATMSTIASNALCLTTTGPAAGINIQGQVTYKIQ